MHLITYRSRPRGSKTPRKRMRLLHFVFVMLLDFCDLLRLVVFHASPLARRGRARPPTHVPALLPCAAGGGDGAGAPPPPPSAKGRVGGRGLSGSVEGPLFLQGAPSPPTLSPPSFPPLLGFARQGRVVGGQANPCPDPCVFSALCSSTKFTLPTLPILSPIPLITKTCHQDVSSL